MYRIDASWPAIGIPACVKLIDELPFHAVGEKYITAVVEGAGGMPLVLPVLGEAYDLPSLLDRLDGLVNVVIESRNQSGRAILRPDIGRQGRGRDTPATLGLEK